MFKKKGENPKGRTIKYIFWSVFFIVITLLYGGFYGRVILGSAVLFEEAIQNGTAKQDMFTYIDAKCVLDSYATTKHTTNFIPTGTDEHFIIVLENGDLISASVDKKKKIQALKEIRSVSYKTGVCMTEEVVTPVRITGFLFTFDPQIRDSFYNHIERKGLNDGNRNIYSLELDGTWTRGKVIGVLALLVLADVFLVYEAIQGIKKGKTL